jgi:hypothetical protein
MVQEPSVAVEDSSLNGSMGRLFATITYATALHRRIEVLQQSVKPCGRISDL